MAIAAINTGHMRCLLQRSDGLLIVAQPLTHQISIYLVQMARCFRQLNEFLPRFGCAGKIPQFILNAQAIGGVALREKPAFARFRQLSQLLGLLRFFLRKWQQH